jgi:hypothetical protein
MLMGVTSWELGVLRVPLIMVPDSTELLLFSKYVTFDPVPWFIICVRLGPSTPGDYVRARVLVPLKSGCDKKQGDVSRIPTAPPAVLLQGSGTSLTATLSCTEGSNTSPTATLACTQGTCTSLPDTLAHSYTPHCTPGLSPCIYKREVQGLPAGGGGSHGDEQSK